MGYIRRTKTPRESKSCIKLAEWVGLRLALVPWTALLWYQRASRCPNRPQTKMETQFSPRDEKNHIERLCLSGLFSGHTWKTWKNKRWHSKLHEKCMLSYFDAMIFGWLRWFLDDFWHFWASFASRNNKIFTHIVENTWNLLKEQYRSAFIIWLLSSNSKKTNHEHEQASPWKCVMIFGWFLPFLSLISTME